MLWTSSECLIYVKCSGKLQYKLQGRICSIVLEYDRKDVNQDLLLSTYPVCIYLIKVNNRNTRTRCEICSKLTIETLRNRDEVRWRRRSSVFSRRKTVRRRRRNLALGKIKTSEGGRQKRQEVTINKTTVMIFSVWYSKDCGWPGSFTSIFLITFCSVIKLQMNVYFSDRCFQFSDKYANRTNKIFLVDFFQEKSQT